MAKALRGIVTTLFLLVPYACGGTSSRSVGGEGAKGGSTGGTGADGGASFTGGVGGTGGSVGGTGGSVGGSVTGGTGADGGKGAVGTTGGSGGRGGSNAGFAGGGTSGIAGTGALPGLCMDPAPMLFSCNAGTPWFYHDGMTGDCVGVGSDQCSAGLEVTFSTLADCLTACPGSKPSLTACDNASECTVVTPGCCGACEPVTADRLAVANLQRKDDVIDCPGGIACGACAPVPEPRHTGQYFVATCGNGNCQLMDLRKTTSTSCSEDSDCFLREGSGCCEGCSGENFISVSSTEFLRDTCPIPPPCAACQPQTSDFEAFCDTGPGRCAMRDAGQAGAAGAGGSP